MLTRYALPALAVVAFAFAVLQMTKAQQKPLPVSPPVDPGKSPFGKQVAGAGIVEPETENISVGTHLPGVVKAVHVRVGQRVKAGDPLFELDDRHLKAELAFRKAGLGSAKAQVTKLGMMPRAEELPPLRAKVAEAQASLAEKKSMYERVRSSPVISAEEVTSRFAAYEVARATLAKAEADLKLAEAGAWEYETAVSLTAVEQAQAQYDQTDTELHRLRVQAPRVRRPGASDPAAYPIPDPDVVEFKVLQVNVRPGEYVGASAGTALVVLGTVGRLHVRVDIDENDIGRFERGMRGVASPRGNPAIQYPITFVRVEPFVIPKKSLTGANTERVDTRVLQVIYALDAPPDALFVGQQLDVSLQAGGE